MSPVNRRQFLASGAAGAAALAKHSSIKRVKTPLTPQYRVYDHLLNPREHPDDIHRPVRAPGWDTYGYRTRFAGGGFGVDNDQIVNVAQVIEKMKDKFGLADAFQATYNILYAENLAEAATEIKKQGAFLHDIEGYIPGCGPGGGMTQFTAPSQPLELIEAELGDHWLGMCNAEQDGRYIGQHAPQLYPSCAGPYEQYLNFHRHFEQLHDDLGNRKIMAIVTLNYGHYLLKEGLYTLIGAETAQGLPNAQLYYSFIRGAGKQYGVPWWAIESVFNRWGYKRYGGKNHNAGYPCGPTKGASLSLLKRLRYSEILYNCVLVGYEQSYFYIDTPPGEDKLSPIGVMQQASRRWVDTVGSVEQLGVMLTPVAVMLDFFSGWTFPRHLYSENIYRAWGNLPYREGGYLTHGVLNMLYPTYQDSSYYHDETGFISPAPYGDGVDCLLSDAESWLLARYPLLVIGGELTGGIEIRDKLAGYVEGGGNLVITAGSLAKLPGGLCGVQLAEAPRQFAAKTAVQAGKKRLVEDFPFLLHPLSFPVEATVAASSGSTPAVVEVTSGAGKLTVIASPFGVSGESTVKGPITSRVDEPLANPFPLLKHVRHVLDGAFRAQVLFEVGDGLSLIACRKKPGEYTLGICNNTLHEQPLKIISRCGVIESLDEMRLDDSEKSAIGYMPAGFEKANLGKSGKNTIAGSDIRVFAVRVREENVQEIPHRIPAARPQGRVLPLPGLRSIQEELLARPTFSEHFDGAMVDWKYLQVRDSSVLEIESRWITRQKIRLFFDLTSGINLYPNLRLIENDEARYSASIAAIEDVLAKMEILGSRDMVLSLHEIPELYFTSAQTWASFEKTLQRLSERAALRHIDLYLRLYRGKLPAHASYYYLEQQGGLAQAVQFLDRVGAQNFRLAVSTAFLLGSKGGSKQLLNMPAEKVGLWLVSAPAFDVAGRLWNVNGRLAPYAGKDQIAAMLAVAPHAPMVLDAVYSHQDQEYLDIRALGGITRKLVRA